MHFSFITWKSAPVAIATKDMILCSTLKRLCAASDGERQTMRARVNFSRPVLGCTEDKILG